MLLSLGESNSLFAQNTNELNQNNTENSALNNTKISDEAWRTAKEGIDYSEKIEKKKPDKQSEKPNNKTRNGEKTDRTPINYPSTSFLQSLPVFGKTAVILAIIALVAGLLYFMSKSALFLGNADVNTELITLEDVENDLHESDLERFLRQALESGNYRLALRIYYLMILKNMSLKEWIEWKKDKTNYEYVRELRSKTDIQPQFRAITTLFERVWYGDTTVQKEDYEQLQPIFNGLLKQI